MIIVDVDECICKIGEVFVVGLVFDCVIIVYIQVDMFSFDLLFNFLKIGVC